MDCFGGGGPGMGPCPGAQRGRGLSCSAHTWHPLISSPTPCTPHGHSAFFPSPSPMDPTKSTHPSHLHTSRTNSLQHLPPRTPPFASHHQPTPVPPCPKAPTNTPTRSHGHLPTTTTPHPPIQALTPPPSSTPNVPIRALLCVSTIPPSPHAPRCPLYTRGRSAPRTAPRPVSREGPPPRYSAVTWRGGCWGGGGGVPPPLYSAERAGGAGSGSCRRSSGSGEHPANLPPSPAPGKGS